MKNTGGFYILAIYAYAGRQDVSRPAECDGEDKDEGEELRSLGRMQAVKEHGRVIFSATQTQGQSAMERTRTRVGSPEDWVGCYS